MQESDVIIVGAGVAGLAAAREIALSGAKPLVLERARGVGGRCATRRVEGQPVDHGVLFLHGACPDFAAAVEAVESPRREGWPGRIEGSGAPCQPDAFAPIARRWVFSGGIAEFPKHLARGVEVRLHTPIHEVGHDGERAVLRSGTGETFRARSVILALALEQTTALLEPLGQEDFRIAGLLHLLGRMSTVPCLTLLAGYPRGVPEPAWDVCYPGDSPVLQLVSRDSAKRPDPRFTVLVCQARPAWSRRRLEGPEELWVSEILEEAGRRLGPWAARPAWVQAHRWRHARLEPGNELAAPVLFDLPGGVRVGLAGELFSPGGGVEAAWISGRRLARRLLGQGDS